MGNRRGAKARFVGEDSAACAPGQSLDDGIPDHSACDLLFATVNLSRFQGHDAEEALDETIAKFVRRFQSIEDHLHGNGRKVTDCDLEELDRIWNDVKEKENH